MDLPRPNLAPKATVLIRAGCSQIGAAVALLSKWKVPITSVRCERGEFLAGPMRLYGGPLPFGVQPPKDFDDSYSY